MKTRARDHPDYYRPVLVKMLEILATIWRENPHLWTKLKASVAPEHRLVLELLFEAEPGQAVSVEAVGRALAGSTTQDREWPIAILAALRAIRYLIGAMMERDDEDLD